jgi:flagellar assembly protein FliH
MTTPSSKNEPVAPSMSADDFEVWSLPNVKNELSEKEKEKTNALGKKSTWRYEPPEEVEVEEVIPLTAEEIDEIRQAAADEGFNQGKEEGFAKGYEEGKAKGQEEGKVQGHEEGIATGLEESKEMITKLSEQWQALVEQLHKPLENVEKNIEEQLLQLVVQLTEAVVLQEAKTNPDILIAAIEAGIKALPSIEAQTQIHLHPDDIKLTEQQFGAEHIKNSGWRLLPSPQLEQGSCQIENSTSNIDLRVKSRLKQVLNSFLEDALHQ